MVAQHGAHLLASRLHALAAAAHHHQRLVGLDVGRDGAGAHVGLVAQDAVAHIVVVGRLHTVEQDDVLQLHGVAHHAAVAHQGAASDKRAVAHLRTGADDTRRAQIGRGRHRGRSVHPHLRCPLLKLLPQRRAQLPDQVADTGQRLPRVGEARQIRPRPGVGQVK